MKEVKRYGLEQKELEKYIDENFSYDKELGILFWKANSPNFKRICGEPVGCVTKIGYIKFSIQKKAMHNHRVIWFIHYKEWPKGHIDHINGDTTDNRIENLRSVSVRKNSQNQKRHREGKLVGAHYHKGSRKAWSSHIKINKKSIYLGKFYTELEAHEAYKKASAQITESE